MARAESVLSPVASGAGRTLDWCFPAQTSYFAGTSGGVYQRIGSSGGLATWQVLQDVNGAGAASSPGLLNGVPCYQYNSAVGTVPGTGWVVHFDNPCPMPPVPIGPAGAVPPVGPWQVVRVWANLALSGTPAADQDYGLELICSATATARTIQGIITNAVAGVGWIWRAAGVPSFMMRGGVGLVFHDVAIPGFDKTLFHAYEVRLVAGNAVQGGQIQAWLDGKLMFAFAAGVEPNFPSLVVGGLPRWQPQLINYAGQNLSLAVQQWRAIAAPTLLNTF